MANSFSVLLSYIDNLMWLCTQLFYGILYIIELNYRLWTALYNGFVQLTLIFKYFIAGVITFTCTYPIAILKTCTRNILEGLYFCVRKFKDMIEIVAFCSSSIANGFYDIINTLKEITTFLIKVMIDYVSQSLAAVFDSVAEGYSSINSFIKENWGALFALKALALCVGLVWVTIKITRLVKSFKHYRPHEMDREPVRPEDHLHHDIHPQGQQQGALQDRNDGDGQDFPVGIVGGEGDQPGRRRPIHTLHTPYSLQVNPLEKTTRWKAL